MSDGAPVPIRDSAVAIEGYSGVVWVTGTDAVSFLDSLLSQNVATMSSGSTAQSLLLGPNGKLRAALHLMREDQRVGLVCDATVAETVAADLARFKIRVDVEIEVEPRPVWEVWGGSASEHRPDLDVGHWTDDGKTVQARVPFRYTDIPRSIVVGARPDVAVAELSEVEAFRIEIGEARVGIDLNEKTIPQEGVDVAATVDFGKGCYLGQELVARIDSRGHVNRRLCGLVFASDTVPPAGSEILHGDKTVGTVTSAAWSSSINGVVGLAMLRVEIHEPEVVVVGSHDAKVVELPISG